jgi:glyoxylate reductase
VTVLRGKQAGKNMMKQRVLILRPVLFLNINDYASKYELLQVPIKDIKEHPKPYEFIIQKINEFKPHAVYLSHFTYGFSKEQNFPHKFLCDDFFQQIDKEHLKIIANHGVGVDHLDLEAAKRHNIIITNTPEVLSDACADFTMLLILSVARRSTEFETRLRNGEWQGETIFGVDLQGKTLGVIGFGSIGGKVAARAKAFGMKVIYHQRNKDNNVEHEYFEKLEDLLAESDFVSLHVPLSSQSKHLINKDNLCLMKKTSYLINTSRGPVVDEQALVDALKNKQIAGCGLDVYENEPSVHEELLKLPNCTLMPHIGTQTSDTRKKMEKLTWDNIEAVFAGKEPQTQVTK